jgi:hypothetical protein
MNLSRLVPVLALVLIAAPRVHAQQPNSLFISADVTTNNDFWQPATNPGAGSSGSCTVGANAVHFFALPFTTDTTGSTYRMQVLFDDLQQGYFSIYRDGFDPQDPCNNLYLFRYGPIANVDNIQLDANRLYVFVASENESPVGGGWFHGTIDGPAGSHIQEGGTPNPAVTFCAGDGGSTACPCGNTGALGHGCASSVDPAGARLSAGGIASVANDTLRLAGTEMPDSFCLYFQGTLPQGGGSGTVFGDGVRCVGGTITRLGAELNASGASGVPSVGEPPLSVHGAVGPGDVRQYQCWYRNAASFCTPSPFNLTNGIQIVWSP